MIKKLVWNIATKLRTENILRCRVKLIGIDTKERKKIQALHRKRIKGNMIERLDRGLGLK